MIKRPYSLILLVAISLSTFPVFAQKTTIYSTNRAAAAAPSRDSSGVSVENIESDVSEALTLIQDKYAGAEKVDYNELFKSSIDSMLHSLDPHSDYFDSAEFEEFRTSQRSEYFGIGATINDLRDKEGNVIGTFVKATFEGSPAQRAGLLYGDMIAEINGESMVGKRFAYVRERLRGPRGTTVKLKIKHYSNGALVPIDIVRDAVSTPSISEAYMVRPGIGYIAMSGGFNQTTFQEFTEQMAHLKNAGMKKLVLDLRFNPGGLVREAYFVANTFLKSGQVIITQNGRGEGQEKKYRAENTNPDDTPLVVLVNGSTASASEILSGALQDHDRALIVGETTFGKGLITNPFPVDYGSMVLLTIARYATPSGRLIQRDYSNGRLYDYQTNGGTLDEKDKPKRPKTDEKYTDSGRVVYGGGGITPDVEVKQTTLSPQQVERQQELVDPLYGFALDLAYGKVKGFENFKVDRPIMYERDLATGEYAATPQLLAAFKNYAVSQFGVKPKIIDEESEFIGRVLRSEIVTAAYGTQTALQVFNEYDPQLKRALQLFPEAEQLARRGARAQLQPGN